MSEINRRRFLDRTGRTALGFAAGATILTNPRSARATPANDRLVLAMIGVGGGRGHSLAIGFLDRDDCEIGYLCDVNRALHEPRAKEYATRQGGKRPKCVQDFREMLTDSAVDAAVIATPPHWHALATILCCRAGKDVYCEKPPTHNCWEGRQTVEAARKYNRIVQIGTQNRSAPYNIAAKQYLEDGKLGHIHLCRVHEQRHETNFQWATESDPPATLDWDMWNGPAPEAQVQLGDPYPMAQAVGLFRRPDVLPGNPPARPGPLALRRRLSAQRLLRGRALQHARGRRDARHAGGHVRVPQPADDLRADALYALHAEERRRHSQRRHLPLLAAERDADRDVRRARRDVRGPHGGGWQVYVRPKDRKPVVKDQMYGRFPDAATRRTSSSRSSRQRPNADIEEGHRSCCWSTTPTSATGSAARSCTSTRRRNRFSTIQRQ